MIFLLVRPVRLICPVLLVRRVLTRCLASIMFLTCFAYLSCLLCSPFFEEGVCLVRLASNKSALFNLLQSSF